MRFIVARCMVIDNLVERGQFEVRITANMVTVTRIVLMPIPGYLLYSNSFDDLFVAMIFIIILGLTDWVDGIMARREGPSMLGGLLDPVADKIFIAAIYLPLTDRGIIPVWLTVCIFARDFLVTTLRTSLSLRDAPMRTSTLAKFKTAMQMIGIGYVILYLTFANDPASIWVWAFIIGPIALPTSLIVYRLIKRQKQGLRSNTMAFLMIVAVTIRVLFGPYLATQITVYVITAMTVISGFSYLVDAWSALKGAAGSYREMMRFALDGLLIPVSFVLLLGRYETAYMSMAIILVITLELTVGGLGNLLASHKITPRFRWMALKSILEVGFAVTALALWYFEVDTGLPVGEMCIICALLVAGIYSVISFWRHRATYLADI
ncbi:MAG: CDP-alcohol phosphatidyltransferase family protein [Proteobacteria bacterium]|nr:CDP-alcohol phosphatidyltransferase family protein [Pseudomonadota bacterium]